LGSIFSLSASVQYEAWTFPVIVPTRRNDVTATVQFNIWPKSHLSHPGSSN
jgi:hypothetical protein